jgi:DNA polymerase type B, organellar and viral
MIKGKERKIKFNLKCSLLLLPLSLEKLIKSLNINISKLPFPYSFVNYDNLNYNDSLPEYKFYKDNLNYDDYLELSKNYKNKT